MTHRLVAFIAVLLASGSALAQQAPPAEAPRVELRPIDRATVRIVAVGGADFRVGEGRRTRLRRVVAMPRAQHGTGVAVTADGLVVTARHVVEGADALAVLFPGGNDALPARTVYVDPDHDVAFLRVPGPVADYLPLAEPRTLRISERVSATGYPIDVRERFPAAVSGELSRENNDGRLQVALGVNPGNSGGPVVDEQGQLIGILSERGEPRAGVEGIALLEPLRFILPGRDRALAAGPVELGEWDHTMARIVADFVRTSDEQPLFEQTAVPTIESAGTRPPTAEAALIIAAHAWNMYVALLEARGVRDAQGLGDQDRATAERLERLSTLLARQVYARAPYMRVRYPVVRAITVSNGRPYVPDDNRQPVYQPPSGWR